MFTATFETGAITAAVIIAVLAAAGAAVIFFRMRRDRGSRRERRHAQIGEVQRLLSEVQQHSAVLSAQVIENLALGTPLKPESLDKIPLDELRAAAGRDAPALEPELRVLSHALSGLALTVIPVLLGETLTKEKKDMAVVEATARFTEISRATEAAERKLREAAETEEKHPPVLFQRKKPA